MPSHPVAKLWNSALKNGSSSNMAVNGSGTPVVFSVGPSANADYDVHTLCLIAEFAGAIGIGNKFLADSLATLTNGLLVEAQFSGASYTWANMKRTRDLLEISLPEGGFNMIAGSVSLIQIFFYCPPFARMCKTGSFPADDFVKATVRDDLRGITYLEMFAQGTKI